MLIGLDLDGVVFDTESRFRAYSEIFDIKNNGGGIVNPNELKARERYNWTNEVADKFIYECIYDIEQNSPLMPYAKEVITMLEKDGHKFVGITARGYTSDKEIEITQDRLKKEGFNFKVVYNAVDKLSVCKEFGVDIMIEDFYNFAKRISDGGVKCLYFSTLVSKPINNDNVTEVKNWGEIYRYFKNLK